MSVKIGNLDIDSFKVGSADCKVYLGTVCVYSGDTPTPPAFEGKWLATYNGGTTLSAECDSTSAITRNQITLSDLVEVEIGNCVTSIGAGCFSACTTLENVNISTGITNIESNIFYNCYNLLNTEIPDGVTSIGNSAFRNCSSLTSITIPSGVTSISDYAFQGCSSLISVTVLATTPPTIGILGNIFSGSNCPIYVPSSAVETYKAASGWKRMTSRIQAIP